MRLTSSIVLFFLAFSASARASTLLVAHDTLLPIKEYSTAGSFIQNWGTVVQNATGPASDEFGNVYGTNPSFGSNVIEKNNSANVSQGTVTAAVSGNWIEDMGYLGGGFLLAGTYEGNVFKIDSTNGSSTLMFSTTDTFIGVTYDGANIWTTGGLSSATVYKRDLAGNILSSFAAPTTVGGIGFDSSDGTLYLGGMGNGTIYHYSTAGVDLGNSFVTGLGSYIDGLEVRNFGVIPSPAASILGLAGFGLLALRRDRRA